MNQEQARIDAAEQAIKLIPFDAIVGVGTGSTVKCFIEALAQIKNKIQTTVASSKATAVLLKQAGLPVTDFNTAPLIDIYVDSADEVNAHKQMIKGGGAALTGEKILAFAAKQFVCIVDKSKCVDVLGGFPLPIEVIPMARSAIARELVKLKGRPVYREGVVTDYGNVLIDVHDLEILDPPALEKALNQIPGIVTNGLFALKPADTVIIGRAS